MRNLFIEEGCHIGFRFKYSKYLKHLIRLIEIPRFDISHRLIRWKIFELTLLNNAKFSFLSKFERIKKWQFDKFIQTHKNLNPIIESNDISNESYLMITPDGKFFQNWYGEYYYSDSILEIGAMNAFDQIKFSFENFETRGAEFFKNLIV